MAHDIFISYSQADKAVADAVCHRMEAAGIRCWIAPRDAAPGSTWDDAVVSAIKATKILVVIFSKAANDSRDVNDELMAAIKAGATIIPFRIEDVQPTGGMDLHLSRVHWLDALTPPLESHIDRLIESAKRTVPVAAEGKQRPEEEKTPGIWAPILSPASASELSKVQPAYTSQIIRISIKIIVLIFVSIIVGMLSKSIIITLLTFMLIGLTVIVGQAVYKKLR